MLIAGAVSGLATLLVFLLRRRRLGGSDEARRFHRALKEGEVPADVDRAHWRRVLADSTTWSRRFRVGSFTLAVMTVALAGSSAVLVPTTRLYALAIAAVFLVVAVTAERLARRNLRRARHLEHELAPSGT